MSSPLFDEYDYWTQFVDDNLHARSPSANALLSLAKELITNKAELKAVLWGHDLELKNGTSVDGFTDSSGIPYVGIWNLDEFHQISNKEVGLFFTDSYEHSDDDGESGEEYGFFPFKLDRFERNLDLLRTAKAKK
ncbi:MAG: hypothetical protein EOP06_00840 [Proteobacteria bacterium]|nr:MAG: hypothetical protein EOP06_00840 [Pseudomonadota bacterium]